MKLTDRQGFSLMTAFLFGNVLSGIGGNGAGPKTGYLSVWLSFAIFVVFSLLFQKVVNNHPNCDFFTVTRNCFGEIGNRIFLIILALYSLAASYLSIANYMEFIKYSITTDFPLTAGIFLVFVLTVYLCLKEEKIMGRFAEIILPIVIGSVILLLILGIREIKEITLPLPTMTSQFLRQGWQLFCSPFSEIIFLWILFDSFKNQNNIWKISVKAGLLTTFLFTLVYLFNLNIAGETVLQNTRFPTYFCASLIEVGILVENAESFITLSYSFCDILYGALCLWIGVKAICRLLKSAKCSRKKIRTRPDNAIKDCGRVPRNLVVFTIKKITAFSAVIFMFLLYSSGMIPTDLSAYYPIISTIFLPITVGLPLLLFFLTKNNQKNKKNQNSNSFSEKL